MSLSKQITLIGIHNSNFTNGNGTATDWDAGYGASTVYEIDTQNYRIQFSPEYFTDSAFDKAISGKLRQNFRGYRLNINLTFNSSLQQTVMRNLFNDLVVAFVTNNAESITVHYDEGTKSNSVACVLDDNQLQYFYQNTIYNFTPSLTFTSEEIITSIASGF